jgi:hypothetical protein
MHSTEKQTVKPDIFIKSQKTEADKFQKEVTESVLTLLKM